VGGGVQPWKGKRLSELVTDEFIKRSRGREGGMNMVFGEEPVVSSSKGAGPAHRTPSRLHQTPKSKAREKKKTWKSTVSNERDFGWMQRFLAKYLSS
jgi:hypothetical protein